MRPNASQFGAISFIAALLQLNGACGEDSRLAPKPRLTVRDATVGEARLSLDGTGRFTFAAPISPPGYPPEIDQITATGLALAWAKDLAPLVKEGLEAERGDTIDLPGLRPCMRVLYARSALRPPAQEVAADPAGSIFARAYGSYWLVPLCAPGGEAAVMVAVSTLSHGITDQAGRLSLPPIGGEWFHWKGIPRHQVSELPVSPERAVVLAFLVSGKRVKALPELVIPDRRDGFPYDARWRMPLEDTTTVSLESGRRRQTAEIFARWELRKELETLELPAPTQPTRKDFRYPTSPLSKIGGSTYATAFVLRDSVLPLDFEPVGSQSASGRGGDEND